MHYMPGHLPCPPACLAARYLERLQVLLPKLSGRLGYGHVNIHSGGCPGSLSMFVSVCLEMHLPPQVDIVLVEFAS
jgi:hypothetical protein